MILETTYWAEDVGPFQHRATAEESAVEQGLTPADVEARLVRLSCPDCDSPDLESEDDAPRILWCAECATGFPRHEAAWELWQPETEADGKEAA